MKTIRSIFLLVSLIQFSALYGQITIISSDMSAIGDSSYMAVDTSVSGISVGQAGANQTWDFSMLDQHLSNLIVMKDPADTPYANEFPDANLAIGTEDFFSYAQLTDDELIFLGDVGEFGGEGEVVTIAYDPTNTIYKFPSTYGTTWTDESGFLFELSEEGVPLFRRKEFTAKTVEIDGYGQVITPEGTYNALRQKMVSIVTDSTWFNFLGEWNLTSAGVDTSEYYEWLAKESKGMLVSVDLDEGSVFSATYYIPQSVGTQIPVADFISADQGEGVVKFTDMSLNNPTSWLWDFGDGTAGSTEQNPQHTYSFGGSFTACLSATNDVGTNVKCKAVNVTLGPIASFVVTDLGNATFQFTDISQNDPDSWLWDFGDGSTSTQQNPMHTYPSPGEYQVCLMVTNSIGTNTSCETVSIPLAPIANFSFTIEEGAVVNFTDGSTNNPTSWVWSFGDGGVSMEQNPSYTYSQAGDFDVCLLVTNEVGSNIVCKTVSIVFAPVADFTFVNQGDGLVEFADISQNNPSAWSWDFGDSNTSTEQNPQYTYTSSGTFSVCLTVSNSAGTNEACKEVTVTITNTEEVFENLVVKVYPNPATETIVLEIENFQLSADLKVLIFNTLGQTVIEATAKENQRLRIKDWAKDVYHYQLITKEGRPVREGTFVVQ
ncbi:MAG: PKD domain-containing protein [Bacteroidetes bacterium]|nr:PKD domain-containing protein [Bacteroidota bacterium]